MKPSQNFKYDAVIIGAGLAGLSCTLRLVESGKSVLLIERSDRVGGRLRTDHENGFQFDHGFQVLLTAYSECKGLLDYDSLQLGRFEPGAYLWTGRKLEIVADPLRQPGLLLKTLSSSSGTLGDKLRIARLKAALASKTDESIYRIHETSARSYLIAAGFSQNMIDSFLSPFFRGIFLEDDLATSNRMFEFVFKMFGLGHAALPAKGMSAIPKQLANKLPDHTLRLNSEVASARPHEVILADGTKFHAKEVILATDMTNAHRLEPDCHDRGYNATRCFYFQSSRSPFQRPMIALNSSGRGVIRNVSTPSDISPAYAPTGQNLICVSTIPNPDLSPETVAEELVSWFGESAPELEYLRSYSIPHALPRQLPGDCAFDAKPRPSSKGLWVCGDHRFSSSIQGALASGRQVAEAVLAKP